MRRFFKREKKQVTYHECLVITPRKFIVFIVALISPLYINAKLEAAGLPTNKGDFLQVGKMSQIKQIQSLRLTDFINSAVWSPSGSELAILSNYGSKINIFSYINWKIKKTFDGVGGAYSFNSLNYLNDNEIITAGAPTANERDAHAIIKWDIKTGHVSGYMPSADLSNNSGNVTYHSNIFTSSADRHLVAAADASIRNGVYLFNADNGNLIKKFRPNTPGRRFFNATSLAFSPNGQEIAIGTGRGKIYIFNVLTGALSREYDLFSLDEYSCAAISFSPNGKYIAVGKRKNENLNHDTLYYVEIIDAESGIIIAQLPGVVKKEAGVNESAPVSQLTWNLSGTNLAVADLFSLRIWLLENVRKPELLLSVERPLGFFSVSYSPDDILAATSGNEVLFFH